jgi:hypothetical protein
VSAVSRRLGPVARETIACLMPLICAGGLFAVIFLLSLIPGAAERSCSHASALSQPVMTLEGFACAEFFLNRYQTLIGVAGAFALGLIAVRPVWRQVALSVQQAIIAGRPFVTDAIDQNTSDTLRLNQMKVDLISPVETLDWLIDVFSEEPESHLVEGILRQFERIKTAVRTTLIEWADLCDLPRLNDDERALRNSLLKELGKISVATAHRVPSPDETREENREREFSYIIERSALLKDGLPSLLSVWEANTAAVREERAALLRHSAAVRKSITTLPGAS